MNQPYQIIFSRDDLTLIAAFAGCSLDEKPGSNWVQDAGGLPDYICRIAKAIKKTGKTTGQAISIAVSRVKKWASGVGVNTDTQVKAAAAVAEWEKLKAKSHASTMAKTASKAAMTRRDSDFLFLANSEYNVDIVRSAFESRTRDARKLWRDANPNSAYDDCPPYMWVKEQWTSFIIVQSDYGKDPELYKIPYEVSDALEVTFGDPVEVKTEYVVVAETDMTGADLTDADLQTLMALTDHHPNPVDKLLTVGRPSSALDKVLSPTRGS